MILLLPAIGAIFAAFGQLLFKLGAEGRVGLMEFVNPLIAGGLACYMVGTALWIYALSKLPLKVVYPFTALTFVVVYVLAWWWLGERLSARGLAGTALVLAGLVLLTSERGLA